VPEAQSAARRPRRQTRNSSNSPHRCQVPHIVNPHIDENFHIVPQLAVRQKLRPGNPPPAM
jgi:hypothetical protein